MTIFATMRNKIFRILRPAFVVRTIPGQAPQIKDNNFLIPLHQYHKNAILTSFHNRKNIHICYKGCCIVKLCNFIYRGG